MLWGYAPSDRFFKNTIFLFTNEKFENANYWNTTVYKWISFRFNKNCFGKYERKKFLSLVLLRKK